MMQFTTQFQSYLYGIEIYWLRFPSSLFRLFQSYLYGIEIMSEEQLKQLKFSFNRTFMELKYGYAFPRYAGMGVSIVPLWNWNGYTECRSHAHHQSFNRTFMELKYWKKDYYTSIRPFQSYLYGIEIWKMRGSVVLNVSFNRTFMELKCKC